MEQKKVNLEEIWKQVEKESQYGMNKGEQLKAMKEACRQVLILASENAKLVDIKRMNCEDHTPYWGVCQNCGQYHNYEVTAGQSLDKQSITNTINQVE